MNDVIYVSEEEFKKIDKPVIIDLNSQSYKIVDGVILQLASYLSQEELRQKVYGISGLNPDT